ncbi:unnamed protein product, partial [Discosporangium mesarthrocarpum]
PGGSGAGAGAGAGVRVRTSSRLSGTGVGGMGKVSTSVGGNGGQGRRQGPQLRTAVAEALEELDKDLRVTGVEEAKGLAALMQEASAWESKVRREALGLGLWLGFGLCASPSPMEDMSRLAAEGERCFAVKEAVDAVRWRCECLRVASQGPENPLSPEDAGRLLTAGQSLLGWAEVALPEGG